LVVAKEGYSGAELENVLHGDAKHTLLQWTSRSGVGRRMIGPRRVYLTAYLDDGEYEKGLKVTDIEFKRLNIT
jgi:hypothetical protein